MEIKKKLLRQVKRSLGKELDSLLQDEEKEQIKFDQVLELIKKVNDSYEEYDDRMNIANRNITISSEELEKRNKDIKKLNHSLQNIFESLGEGLMVFDSEGTINPHYSKTCEHIFSGKIAGRKLFDILEVPEGEERDAFDLWLSMIFTGQLDLDLINELGPTYFINSSDEHYKIKYRPIEVDNEILGVTVVASNCTLEFQAQKEREAQQRRARIIDNIVRHQNDFNMFMSFVMEVLDSIRYEKSHNQQTLNQVQLNLHTVKGSCGYFGIEDFAEEIQKLELEIKSLEDRKPQEARAMALKVQTTIEDWMTSFRSEFKSFFKGDESFKESVTMSKEDLLQIIDDNLKKSADKSEWVLSVVGDPVDHVLDMLKGVAEKTAQNLNKEIEPVSIETDGFRLVRSAYGRLFQSFTHLVRNAIDHGFEDPSDRLKKGKPEKGCLEINAFITSENPDEQYMNFVFKDDGRGFDFAKLKEKLEEQGHYDLTDNKKIMEKTLEGGVSSKNIKTQVSGFGVGVSAVFKEVEKVNGKLKIESKKDVGTTITVTVPKKWVDSKMMEDILAA